MQPKRTVLHLGDPVKYNHDIYKRFASQFNVVRPSDEERDRPAFMTALRERRWGNFDAIFRPFWNTGGEMGRWDAELVPLLPESVKIFASAGAGYDWADVDILAKHGIVYCNGAAASSEAVADVAIFHILSAFRNLTWSHLAARSSNPQEWTNAHRCVGMTAWNPRGHSLGIIGLGSIGYTTAQKAYAAFGMKILYHDVIRKPFEQEDPIKATFFDKLDDLLAVSDCVVLATPFFGKKVIDRDRLQKFKKGGRFVNIARGMLVDEEALVDALKTGHLFAAGLDVFEREPHVHPELTQMMNVSLTCHNGGAAQNTHTGFERLAMENVEKFLLKGKALTPVNLHLMPFNGVNGTV
ncbi:glyoxylate/hydroxypyruvate reductase [Lineolata rhizophorae]|uniref:Glyoxylate/hydroxypyruvate reductase n=1 Tax=Lineolata rhizophorae TaxID=578093 RepID=A0A6A6P949_9PEZI|nr:glyoxylate/hydroxypyruvate reductase [Lineolata rhizophorae]